MEDWKRLLGTPNHKVTSGLVQEIAVFHFVQRISLRVFIWRCIASENQMPLGSMRQGERAFSTARFGSILGTFCTAKELVDDSNAESAARVPASRQQVNTFQYI